MESRVVHNQTFDPTGHTSENSLTRLRLSEPDRINSILTFMQGMEDKKFPLTFLTEGQVGKKGVRNDVEVNNVEYFWDFINKIDKASAIAASSYTSTSKPGLGGSPIYVTFEDNWLKRQHIIVAPDGSQCRVNDYVEVSGGYEYNLQYLSGTGADSYCPPAMLATNIKWVMEGPGVVSESNSRGNESNVVGPGKVKNQISVLRKSYEIAGNISNKVTEVNLVTAGKGGKKENTKLWMPWEEWQHEITWKTHVESHLWWSHFNQDEYGRIMHTDPETNLPIPIGAGVVDQIPHHDTYFTLTTQKLDSTVLSVMFGRSDEWQPQEVVLYTGRGGAREFDRAMKNTVAGLSQIIGDKFVYGTGHQLKYGGYFNAYETIEGLRIIVKHLPLLDKGPRSNNSPKHPETGLPLSSYEMFFVDHTSYDGIPNVRLVSQKGRSMIRGIEQGMSLIKGQNYMDYEGNGKELLVSTDQDMSAIHYLSTKGVQINRNSHCFRLSPDISIGV